jgi:hypothetical protein
MKGLEKIRCEFGTEIAVGAFSAIAILFWVCESFGAVGENAEMKLLFQLDSARGA